MVRETASKLSKRYAALKGERESFQPLWDDSAFYYQPESDTAPGGYMSAPGGETAKPVTSFQAMACGRLASGMYSFTVQPGVPFFRLRNRGESFMAGDTDEAEAHVTSAVESATINAINDSNFNNAAFEAMRCLAAFNTVVMFTEWDGDAMLPRYTPIQPWSCCLSTGPDGIVNTIFRDFEMSIREAESYFSRKGDSLPPRIQKILGSGDEAAMEEKVTFVHAVFPRKGGEARAVARNKPFASYYFIEDDGGPHVIRESGYDSFPYAVARFWVNARETFGRGPSFQMLPDARQLNNVTADRDDRTELQLKPPSMHSSLSDMETFDISPGAMNMISGKLPNGNVAWPEFLMIPGDIRGAEEIIVRLEDRLWKGFYADLFDALENRQNMSATEVVERVNQKAQSISPVITRLQSEFFKPIIERTVMLVIENLLTEWLASVEGVDGDVQYEVVYVSRVNERLSRIETQNLRTAVAEAAEVATVTAQVPGMSDHVNLRAAIEFLFDSHSVVPGILRPRKEAQAIIEEREEREQAAMAAQAMSSAVKPVDIQKSPDPGALLEGM